MRNANGGHPNDFPTMQNRLSDDLDHILHHTQNDWEELRGQRIFITGGTGFFGCWLLESFLWANEKLELNAQAVVLTRDAEKFGRKVPHLAHHPAISLHEGDVQSFKFPAGEFSHIIHAATDASATLNATHPTEMLETVVFGTRRVLDFAASCKARKFLLTSSGAVYGRQPAQMTHIPESYAGAPDVTQSAAAYGEGKRIAELLCVLYARNHDFEVKIARCFAFVGPYLPLDATYAIGNFIRDGLNGNTICIQGDGTPRRSYLYAADLTIWLWKMLFHAPSGRAYNVGSEQELSIAKVAYATKQAFNDSINVEIKEQALSGAPVQRYVPSVARARDELGLQPTFDLAQSLQKTICWHREHIL